MIFYGAHAGKLPSLVEFTAQKEE